MFVLGDGPKEVGIVISVVAGDASLGAVADNHRPKIIINHHHCCHYQEDTSIKESLKISDSFFKRDLKLYKEKRSESRIDNCIMELTRSAC